MLLGGRCGSGVGVFTFDDRVIDGRPSPREASRLRLLASAGKPAQPSLAEVARLAAIRLEVDDPLTPWSFRNGLVVAPISYGAERLGALALWPAEADADDDERRQRRVQGVAAAIGTMLACGRLEAEAELQRAELRALEEIGRVVERTATTEGILEGIFEASVRSLRCDTASLFVVDERGESLQMIAGRNMPEGVIHKRQFRMGEGVAGWVAAQNRSAVVADVSEDPRYSQPESGLDGPRSLLVVPLRLRGKVIATLCFARQGANAFASPDLELAEKIAVYTAQALEHARLSKLQAKAQSLELRFETLSAVSHDIRTSLTYVKLAAKLAQHSPTEEQRDDLLAQIIDRVDQIGALINAGLEASRLESQLTRLHITSVPLRALVDEVLEELSPTLGPQHRLKVDIPDDLEIRTDPMQMRRVLANLVDNAIKYSPKGGDVVISGRATADGTLVSVRDEGVGIAPEHLGHVFEQFYRTPEVSSSPGFGLGLYTCRRIIEAHGGRIQAESTPGRGSTFWFAVPGALVVGELATSA